MNQEKTKLLENNKRLQDRTVELEKEDQVKIEKIEQLQKERFSIGVEKDKYCSKYRMLERRFEQLQLNKGVPERALEAKEDEEPVDSKIKKEKQPGLPEDDRPNPYLQNHASPVSIENLKQTLSVKGHDLAISAYGSPFLP
jgi:predicted nuclease with TOPRIM domain